MENLTGPRPSTRVRGATLLCAVLGSVFVLALAVRMACFTGLIASDDLGYAGYAQQIAQGTYRLEAHHYAIRYGVTVPVAALYRLFGVHEWDTTALPLLASSLAAALGALVGWKLSGIRAGWITGLLLATFPVDIRYGSVLVPEPMLSAVLLGGVLLFLLAEERNSPTTALAAGFAFGLSYLTKEPGLFVAIAFIAFVLVRRRWPLAVALATGVGIVICAELIWYWSQTGDILFRLHAMAIHNESEMAVEANANLGYRLWKVYPRLILVPSVDFGLHSVFAVVLAAVAILRRARVNSLLLLLWAAVPLFYLNFGTSSFSHYWALPAAPRYIGFVFVPLFIMAATTLVAWAGEASSRKICAGLVLSIVCVVGIVCAASTRRTGYRTEHVERLKEIARMARRDGRPICEFSGPDGVKWRQTLQIVAGDTVGCGQSDLIRLEPDSRGLPVDAGYARLSSRGRSIAY